MKIIKNAVATSGTLVGIDYKNYEKESYLIALFFLYKKGYYIVIGVTIHLQKINSL